MCMEQEIANWDGKSASDIGEIYLRYQDEPFLTASLVELSQKPGLQKGTTWLLKRHFENGKAVSTTEVSAMFKLMSKINHWEAKLHILQCLPYISIRNSEKKIVEGFLRKGITDANKLVRAWAYSGFYELANQYDEYKLEARQLLDMAMKDEAASVRARGRKILKEDF